MRFDTAKSIPSCYYQDPSIRTRETAILVGFTIQTQASLRELYHEGDKFTGGMEVTYPGNLPWSPCYCWEKGDPEATVTAPQPCSPSPDAEKNCFLGSLPLRSLHPDSEAECLASCSNTSQPLLASRDENKPSGVRGMAPMGLQKSRKPISCCI